jgi:hypothetical protein
VVVQDEKLIAKLSATEEKLSLMEKEKLRIQKVSTRIGGITHHLGLLVSTCHTVA